MMATYYTGNLKRSVLKLPSAFMSSPLRLLGCRELQHVGCTNLQQPSDRGCLVVSAGDEAKAQQPPEARAGVRPHSRRLLQLVLGPWVQESAGCAQGFATGDLHSTSMDQKPSFSPPVLAEVIAGLPVCPSEKPAQNKKRSHTYA